jgi:hypothetical protein
MSEVIGNMTEVARIDAGKLKVVVSYWTNDKGERYEPRLRFLVGERERPSKGLTRNECLAVRDAFNQLCIEWASDEGTAAKEEQLRVYTNAAASLAEETKDNVVKIVLADKPKGKSTKSASLVTKSPADAIAELLAKASAPTK